jgi:hypothetical protein
MFIGLLLLLWIGVIAQSAYAADATVNTCDFATLSSAVALANSGGGTITFNCSGTITFTGELTITDDVQIVANGNTVIFDGNTNTRLFVVAVGAMLSLSHFTLQNGYHVFGGAIYNNGGTLNIAHSQFVTNGASSGGAVYNNGGAVNITHSTLQDNWALLGGAIYNHVTTLAITNSTLSGNIASSGGAIYNNGGTVGLIDTILSSNLASTGEATYNVGVIFSQNTHYAHNTCHGFINDLGGNTVVNATGCPGVAPLALQVSALSCHADALIIDILAGDLPVDITGVGSGLPIYRGYTPCPDPIRG